jgi:hypothetical protein
MLNKKIQLLVAVALTTLTLSAHAQNKTTALTPAEKNARFDKQVEIIHRDQVDNTDVYAIQLDDSEVEDEQELNTLEGKKVFDLPEAAQPAKAK